MKKTVLVTGSSRGIGRAVALKFASCGYHVVINCARSTERMEEVKKEVEALGAECLAVQADVGNPDDCKRLFKEIESRFDHVDVLVNNAGISIIGLLQDLSFEDWNRILSANLSSVFHCAKLAIPGMIHNHSGKIINISSVWGVCGASCEAAYSATKGGVNGLTMALAKELAPSGIQVNAIACGAIDTEMNGFLSDEEHEMLLDEIPTGRMGKPEEVADETRRSTGLPDRSDHKNGWRLDLIQPPFLSALKTQTILQITCMRLKRSNNLLSSLLYHRTHSRQAHTSKQFIMISIKDRH